MRACCALLALVSIAISSPSQAGVRADEFGAYLAKTFVGGCVQVLPDIERIRTAARVLGWAPMSNESASLLAPQNKSATWSGWVVTGNESPSYLMFISAGEAKGKNIHSCGIMQPKAPYDDVVPKMQKFLGLGKPDFVEHEPGQRVSTWNFHMAGRQYGIVVLDMSAMGEPGLNISAFTEAVK